MVSILRAHPFEAKLVGHDLHCVLQPDAIFCGFDLEVPIEMAQQEWQAVRSDSSVGKEEWIQKQYREIQSNLVPRVQDAIVDWQSVEYADVTTKNQDKFLVYKFTGTIDTSHIPTQTIASFSIVNSNRMGDMSIFRTRLDVEKSITVWNTDQIVWKESKPLVSTLDKWEMEEKHREIRCSIEKSWNLWREIILWWEEDIQGQETVEDLWSHVQQRSWFTQLQQRDMDMGYWLFPALALLPISCIRRENRDSLVEDIVLNMLLISFLSWLPPVSMWVYITMGLLWMMVVLWRNKRVFRPWIWLPSVWAFLLHPSWMVLPSLLLILFGSYNGLVISKRYLQLVLGWWCVVILGMFFLLY